MDKEQAVRRLRALYLARHQGPRRFRLTIDGIAAGVGATPPSVYSWFRFVKESDAGASRHKGKLPGSISTVTAILAFVKSKTRNRK